MAKITIHAGDFKNTGMYAFGSLHLSPRSAAWGAPQEIVSASSIEEIDIATEATVRKAGGVIGWGAAGFVIAGPAGILGAILLGAGKRKEVTFVARLTDGRKILATTDGSTYTKLSAAVFNRAHRAAPSRPNAASTSHTPTPPSSAFVFCPACNGWSVGRTCSICGAEKPRSAPTRAG